MEKDFQAEKKEDGINLVDILKTLLGKIKLLIFIVIAGAIVGCTIGIGTTYDVHYYGTKLEYYVNPKRSASSTDNQSQYGVYGAYGKNVMDNMVKLLSSESFAEKLLLDSSGLPREWLSSEKRTEVLATIEEANAAVEKVTKLEEELEDLNDLIPELQEEYTYVNQTYSEALDERKSAENLLLEAQKGGVSSTIVDGYIQKLEKATEKAEAALLERDAAREELKEAKDQRTQKEKEIKAADELALELLDTSNKAVEKILSSWRQTESYKDQLNAVKSSITYSYLEETDIEASEANDFARSFFYIEIVTLNNEEFANFLLQRIKEELPTYIEANMAIPTGYEKTNCLMTSRVDNIQNLNPDLMKSQAIKYGFLLAAVSFIIACIVIILLENSNKKLRDYDVLTNTFNLPVLGVIPAIEAVDMPEVARKKEMKTEDKR